MIVTTKRNQRLGDLAGGTLVIRDAPARRDVPRRSNASEPLDAAGWDVSAVSIEELATVRRFLERRTQLDARARRELAYRLEQGLRPKVAGAPERLDPERFLEELERVRQHVDWPPHRHRARLCSPRFPRVLEGQHTEHRSSREVTMASSGPQVGNGTGSAR